ncbi:MAG: BlaI/MecI/CopY family transcriptional regulator [Saprospiraceae bacterium]|nr:BlaI/MecI/CopY family transcriptional regulator [Saprospiraceae bacterium]
MKKPTTAELEILKVLWESGPASVRDVHNQLSEGRDVYYTTTLKTMQVMVAKGLLERDTSQRAHIYAPTVSRRDIAGNLIDGLVDGLFKGSTARLVVSAIGRAKPTPEELAEIRALLDNLENPADATD